MCPNLSEADGEYAVPYVLLVQREANEEHDPLQFEFHGMTRSEFKRVLSGPTTLLNLSYSVHPPFALAFERRILCNLDPTEICYWMPRLEMGQSSHTEFWTIGLNTNSPDCKLPASVPGVTWNTFFPMVDTDFLQKSSRPFGDRITTVGQWYWSGYLELEDGRRDLSKKAMFEPYLTLPREVPEITWEIAMHMNENDWERARLQSLGWRHVFPHDVVSSPSDYYRYLEGSLAEFTPVKVDDITRSGWISDRAAAYLALGRPVITESTAAAKYLPERSGFLWVHDTQTAAEAARRVVRDWDALSRSARDCAIECFDSVKNLRKVLFCTEK